MGPHRLSSKPHWVCCLFLPLDIGPFVGKMLLSVSRARNNSAVHEVPARGNGSPAFASSETSTLRSLTCHVFLERERLMGMETQ